MKMDFSLQMTQQQKLIMTQQMQLSVNILQMSANDLKEYINKEIQENPVLEIQYENKDKKDEIDYKNFLKHLDVSKSYNQSNYDDEKVSPFNFISSKETLKEYLKEQILESDISQKNEHICNYIIENLDNRGYLDNTTESISKEMKIAEEFVLEALSIVQNLEPHGVGARNIEECLKIQLKKKGIDDENLFIIVDEYLELVADNKYVDIAKKLNIDAKTAQNYGDIIKTLEPKPSRGFFTGEEVKYIVPDAYIRKIDDEYYIIMNDDIIPRLNVNSLYKDIINKSNSDDGTDDKTKDYVKDKLNSAFFLIKSIQQRKNTLYRVLEQIIEIQRDYFEHGKNHLKPMTLKDISNELEMHESTISRAIKEKYIGTSNGTIKIKDLFTTGIESSYGQENVSRGYVHEIISELIDKEDKKKPLSDQKISEMLAQQDLKVSRRTVAKYREEMGIKASSKRKRY